MAVSSLSQKKSSKPRETGLSEYVIYKEKTARIAPFHGSIHSGGKSIARSAILADPANSRSNSPSTRSAFHFYAVSNAPLHFSKGGKEGALGRLAKSLSLSGEASNDLNVFNPTYIEIIRNIPILQVPCFLSREGESPVYSFKVDLLDSSLSRKGVLSGRLAFEARLPALPDNDLEIRKSAINMFNKGNPPLEAGERLSGLVFAASIEFKKLASGVLDFFGAEKTRIIYTSAPTLVYEVLDASQFEIYMLCGMACRVQHEAKGK